ncbi:MAG: hypothetical protein BGO51_09140 [Rhodospirillales bacterium 69-11]|nr:MAG: hypothetical protein BGO51_09140 [Rhodospirillales bacterium 69-11]
MTRRPPLPTPPALPAARIELCLDYVNTRFWRGSDAPEETLAAPQDLLAWIGETARVPAAVLAAAPDAAALLPPAIGLRETIHRLFDALAADLQVAEADLAALNAALAAAPSRASLVPDGAGFGWALRMDEVTLPVLLAPVLWSAGDLLASAAQHRIRRCANEKCRWLFLDRSKAGTRRWCDMAACGNRAKAQRHYARSKGG